MNEKVVIYKKFIKFIEYKKDVIIVILKSIRKNGRNDFLLLDLESGLTEYNDFYVGYYAKKD